MSSIYDFIKTTDARLDSLDAAEAQDDSTKLALEAIKTKEARIDSLQSEIGQQEEALQAMTTAEKASEIPIVKGVKWGAEKLAQLGHHMQMLQLSTALNLQGIPLNTLGRIFGYNPGFSGERFLQKHYGDHVTNLYSKLGMDVGPVFDEERVKDTAWGTYAPEGGEWSYEAVTRKKQAALEEEIKKEEGK